MALKDNAELLIVVTVMNYLTNEIKARIFVILEEFIEKYSLVNEFTLSSGKLVVSKKNVIIKKPPNGANFIPSLGVVKISIDGEPYGKISLPSARFDTTDKTDNYLGVGIVLNNDKAVFACRYDIST